MDVLFQGADKPENIGPVVLTDFSKAFDRVAIQKLIHSRVRGLLFHNFLVFYIAVNSVCAISIFFLPLFAGVPQGTKLGPIAFQEVISDAAVDGTAHYRKCVDDLTFAEK